MALQDHAERVADEQDVDALGVAQGGEAGVITGEHGDLVAGGAHLGQVEQAQAALRGLGGHGGVSQRNENPVCSGAPGRAARYERKTK